MPYTQNLERVFFGVAPTLKETSEVFGKKIAESWLEIQLNNLSEYSGCKEKLTTTMLSQIAQVIIAMYDDLKLTELMLFFLRFKGGQYGKFYGAVDGMVITTALQEFLDERTNERFEILDKQEKERAELMDKYKKEYYQKREQTYCKNFNVTADEYYKRYREYIDAHPTFLDYEIKCSEIYAKKKIKEFYNQNE